MGGACDDVFLFLWIGKVGVDVIEIWILAQAVPHRRVAAAGRCGVPSHVRDFQFRFVIEAAHISREHAEAGDSWSFVAAFKEKLASADAFSEEEFRRRDSLVWDLRAATLSPERAAQRSADDGKRSPVETY